MSKSEIPGINMAAGFTLYGGEMDIYIAVMESFAANTPAVIDKLRDVTKETLPEYAINIHGLKSISATIAAQDISERARKLELMAEAGDLAGVLAENGKLLEDTEILVNDLKNWLETSGNK